ncbi:MAG: methyltransferase domain-containing protein [candidate division WOR-3 bacterium]|nr:methyltransferase domain-containing protein [candidate division WOR-3 bacterium]
MRLPEDLEAKILSELHLDGLYQSAADYRNELDTLRKEMVSLSFRFAAHQRMTEENYNAYFCYNFPQNFMKSVAVMKRLYGIFKIPLRDEYRILDIGCGEGAGLWGLCYYLNLQNPNCRLFLTGIDVNGFLLKRCQSIGEWFKEKHPYTEILLINESAIKFLQVDKGQYDFIILSNSLVEISQSRKIPISFIQMCMNHLKKGGFVIIIEPALKNLTRRLMELRKSIIENRIGIILLPCLHNEKCPLLIKIGEWCHQSIKWQPPDFIKIINQKLFRKVEYLKFAYLVITDEVYKPLVSIIYPVIGRVAKEKGRARCFVCSNNGVIELLRLDRDESAKNEIFIDLTMGDFVEVNDELRIKSYLWRINDGTSIKRLDF